MNSKKGTNFAPHAILSNFSLIDRTYFDFDFYVGSISKIVSTTLFSK